MKGFYEQVREKSGLAIATKSFAFPAHYHANLEIFLLERGSYLVTVNGKTYAVEEGGIVFSDSYDIHSYERVDMREDESGYVVIIPYSYLQRFNLWH